MISDLLKELKGDIVSFTNWIKTFSIIGNTIIAIKNVPGMKIINNFKNIILVIFAIPAIIIRYMTSKKRR